MWFVESPELSLPPRGAVAGGRVGNRGQTGTGEGRGGQCAFLKLATQAALVSIFPCLDGRQAAVAVAAGGIHATTAHSVGWLRRPGRSCAPLAALTRRGVCCLGSEWRV